MIIIHVVNKLTIGGIEKVVTDLSNGLENLGNELYIITLSNDDLQLKDKLNTNIKLISLPFNSSSKFEIFKFWFFGFQKMKFLIDDIKPQIVHSHLYYHYFFFISLCLKYSKIKPIHFRTVHTSGLFYNSTTLINKFRLFVEKIASKIYPLYLISISKTIHKNNQLFFSKYVKKINLIPNGIDLKKFSKSNFSKVNKNKFGFDDDKVIVSYVSRLDKGKNHDCLIKAWANVVQIYPNTHLCLIGDGILKKDLINQSVNLNLEQSVTLFGAMNNVAEFLSITDIGVFPSQFEGFPISLLEKMAMGLPVIVSDIDIFKEIITHNINGVIYSVNNSENLADSILDLIYNKEKRLQIGKNANQLTDCYNIETIVKSTINFYEQALYI